MYSGVGGPEISWVSWKVDGRITLRLWTKSEREATDNLTECWVLAVNASFHPAQEEASATVQYGSVNNGCSCR